jgi:carboxymethylenebutenolidase
MCFDLGARPPLPPIRGGALDAGDVTLRSADATSVAAFAARAERPTGAGIVIIPDVRGLHPYYEELALRFAEAGVHAVAIDPYSRTAGTSRRDEGFDYEPHVKQLTLDGASADVTAAVDVLRAQGGPAERVYTVGFCLGGRLSLLQATSAAELSGVIGFYAWPVGPHRSGIPAPADEAARFRCPVLTLYGGADTGIPAEARDAFAAALEAAGVRHDSVTYDGAPHSFFDRRAAEHADASADAWRRMLAFMDVAA